MTLINHPLPEDRDLAITASFQRTTTGVTDWVKLFGDLAVQLTGSATAVTAQVERSAYDPDVAANTAPAGAAITGNPATGIAAVGYTEPGAAWWRVNVTALTGASVDISISGRGWR